MTRPQAETLIGAVALLAIAGAFTAVTVVGDFNPLIPKDRIYALFEDVNFIEPGSVVRSSGLIVGMVDEMKLRNDGVLVTLQVDNGFTVHPEYRIEVRSLTLLGGRYVEVVPGRRELGALRSSPEKPLDGRLEAEMTKEIGDIFRQVEPIIVSAFANIAETFEKVEEAQGTLGKLISDPSFSESLGRSFTRFEITSEHLRRISTKVEEGTGTLGRLLSEPRFGRAMDDVRERLGAILDRVDAGRGTVGAVVRDETVGDALERAGRHLSSVVDGLFGEEGMLAGPRFERIREDLERTMDGIATIIERVRDGRGPIFVLTSDESADRFARIGEGLDRFANRPEGSTIGRMSADPTLPGLVEGAFRDFSESTADNSETSPVSGTLQDLIRAQFDSGSSDSSLLGGN